MKSYETILKANHWKTNDSTARFHLHQAANNSPGMRMGSIHTAMAVILLKKAYNRVRFRKHLAHLPALVEHGIYDINTAEAIAKFQTHFGLSSDGISGKQTFVKLDELLVEIENSSFGFEARMLRF